MEDDIESLRLELDLANTRIKQLEKEKVVHHTKYTMVEVDRVVYVDNPDHIKTILNLQQILAGQAEVGN